MYEYTNTAQSVDELEDLRGTTPHVRPSEAAHDFGNRRKRQSLPASVDWRSQGAVGPVKDQMVRQTQASHYDLPMSRQPLCVWPCRSIDTSITRLCASRNAARATRSRRRERSSRTARSSTATWCRSTYSRRSTAPTRTVRAISHQLT